MRRREGGPGSLSTAVGLCAPGRKIPTAVFEGRILQSFTVFIFLSVKDQCWIPDQDSEEEKDIDNIILKQDENYPGFSLVLSRKEPT